MDELLVPGKPKKPIPLSKLYVPQPDLKVELPRAIKTLGPGEVAQTLLYDRGFKLETAEWLLKAYLSGNPLKLALQQYPDHVFEKPADLPREVKILEGREIIEWLEDKPENWSNLISAYRDVYGNSEWHEGMKLKTDLSDSDRETIKDLDLQTYYSYQEFRDLLSKEGIDHRSIRKIYEEYYPTQELKDRLYKEFMPTETSTPILMLVNVEHPDMGSMIVGFSWATMYVSDHAIEAIARRIVDANYVQTADLQATKEVEEKNIAERVYAYQSPFTATPRSEIMEAVCYIDEIAILPEFQRGTVFKTIFPALLTTIAKAGLATTRSTSLNGVTYFFRTLGSGRVDEITNKIFGEMMPIVYESTVGAEGPRMIYKALFGTPDFLESFADENGAMGMIQMMLSSKKREASSSTPEKVEN